MSTDRIKIHGDYLIIAPNPDGTGYVHSLTERTFLVENLANFIARHKKVEHHNITIYELREVNEYKR